MTSVYIFVCVCVIIPFYEQLVILYISLFISFIYYYFLALLYLRLYKNFILFYHLYFPSVIFVNYFLYIRI